MKYRIRDYYDEHATFEFDAESGEFAVVPKPDDRDSPINGLGCIFRKKFFALYRNHGHLNLYVSKSIRLDDSATSISLSNHAFGIVKTFAVDRGKTREFQVTYLNPFLTDLRNWIDLLTWDDREREASDFFFYVTLVANDKAWASRLQKAWRAST